MDKYKLSDNCPYCDSEVIKTTNDKIYGKKYGNGMCYKCVSCDAYVGCHTTGDPLGRLANAQLRGLKQLVHILFDPIWKSRKLKRGEAYQRLADKMGIPKKECHFGWFGEKQLMEAIEILKAGL